MPLSRLWILDCRSLLVALFLFFFVAGCSLLGITESPPKDELRRAAEAQPALSVPPPKPDDGSIPIDLVASHPTADYKARRVGDVVTIQVSESVAGSTGAQAALGNQSSLTAGISHLFGFVGYLNRHTSMTPPTMADTNYASKETGNGSLSATDTFTGNVSAVVTHVTPEGNLVVKGFRRIRINGEDDQLVLSGIVRPQDLDSNNQVDSSLVADLQLALTGKGQVRDQQGFGWGERAVSWLWPF